MICFYTRSIAASYGLYHYLMPSPATEGIEGIKRCCNPYVRLFHTIWQKRCILGMWLQHYLGNPCGKSNRPVSGSGQYSLELKNYIVNISKQKHETRHRLSIICHNHWCHLITRKDRKWLPKIFSIDIS